MYVYADNAATTKLSDGALRAMLPYFSQHYGNPSSLHSMGQQAAEVLSTAREKLAALILPMHMKSTLLLVAVKQITKHCCLPQLGVHVKTNGILYLPLLNIMLCYIYWKVYSCTALR